MSLLESVTLDDWLYFLHFVWPNNLVYEGNVCYCVMSFQIIRHGV